MRSFRHLRRLVQTCVRHGLEFQKAPGTADNIIGASGLRWVNALALRARTGLRIPQPPCALSYFLRLIRTDRRHDDV